MRRPLRFFSLLLFTFFAVSATNAHGVTTCGVALADFSSEDFAEKNYATLNEKIHQLLVEIPAAQAEGFEPNTQLLSRMNDRILLEIQKIQASFAPGKLKSFFSLKKSVKEKTEKIVQEVALCKARGQACAFELRPRLEEITRHQADLKKFSLTLQNEIQNLNQLLAQKEVLESEGARGLILQRENLLAAEISLQAHLQINQQWVTTAIVQLELFENNLSSATRMLFVTAPLHGTAERELLKSQEEKIDYNRDAEQFSSGKKVLALNEVGYKTYAWLPATIQELKPNSKIAVKPENSWLGRTKEVLRTEVALLGCHHGICSGEIIRIFSSIMGAQASPSQGSSINVFLRGNFEVLAFNPETNQFLLKSLRNTFAWADKEDLVAVKEQRPLPVQKQTPIRSKEDFKPGDKVFVVRDQHNEFQELRVLEVLSVEEKILLSDKNYYETSDVFFTGCIGGICTGDLMEDLPERRGSKTDPNRIFDYRVVAHRLSSSKVFLVAQDRNRERAHASTDPDVSLNLKGYWMDAKDFKRMSPPEGEKTP